MRESIFLASIRSFFVFLFGSAGLLIGLLLIVILIGALSTTAEGEPEINYTYSPEIQPNAEGIRKALSSDAPVILKINITSIIGLETLNRHNIQQLLIESRERSFKDGRVKAVLLYIDSPGGTVIDADGIYRSLKLYKNRYKVPIYAYIDGLCASGGLYIACAADKIYASSSSLIGSVGVLLPTAFNVTQLMEKIGVQGVTLYDGKGKDNLNPFRPWHKGEEQNIKDAISYNYDMFVDVVSTNRPQMDKNKLINEYGANVYPAAIAKDYGYIDESNVGLEETIKQLAEKIGIKDTYYQVIELESKNWLSTLFKSKFNLLQGEITHQLNLTPEMHPKLQNQFLYLYK